MWLSLYCVQVEEYQYWMYLCTKSSVFFFVRFRDNLAIFWNAEVTRKTKLRFCRSFYSIYMKVNLSHVSIFKTIFDCKPSALHPTLCKDGLRTFALIFIFFSDAIIQISWYYCKMFSTFSSLFENSGFILLYHYWYKFRYVLTSYYNLVKLIIEY